MTKDQFKTILIRLKEYYPNFNINTEQIQSEWLKAIGDLEYSRVSLATSNYIREEKYPPTIKEFMTYYDKVAAEFRDLINDYESARGCFPKELQGEDDKKTFLTAIKSQAFNDCKSKAISIRRHCYEYCSNQVPEKTFMEVVKEWMQNNA